MIFSRRVSAILLPLLLAACGGGSDPDVPGTGSPAGAPTTKGTFLHIVSFGDSLSDIGTYAPATSLTNNGVPPYLGGKFTTNETGTGSPTTNLLGKVWVENLAASLGIVVTPAMVGFGASSVACPAAAVPAIATSCTAYGQGGSRITDPNGINHSGGALTVPVVTQIANHLARFTSFKSSDLIFVYAGSNDVFTQFGAFAAAAGAIQANTALTADQMNLQLFAAQQAAEAAMQVAAQDLVNDIKTQILAKGGSYVAVMTLSDIADTPFGNSLPASAKPVLTALSQIFNLWLRDGLTGVPVQIIDTYALFKTVAQNPASYGFTNSTTPACDVSKINAILGLNVPPKVPLTSGYSLFCNATPGAPYNGLRTGADVNTWQFSDDVHPTTGGHKALSDAFTLQLKSFGWI